MAYLVQYPMKKPGTIPVLRSLPRCGRNILVDFLGKNVFGSELFYATSELGKILGRFNSRINGRREWVYFLDHSKIVNKLRETIGEIEQFSDTPHANSLTNISTDVPIFDVPAIVTPQSEKIESAISDLLPAPIVIDEIQEQVNVHLR